MLRCCLSKHAVTQTNQSQQRFITLRACRHLAHARQRHIQTITQRVRTRQRTLPCNLPPVVRSHVAQHRVHRIATGRRQAMPCAAQLQDVQAYAHFVEHIHRGQVATFRRQRQPWRKQTKQIQHACGKVLAILRAMSVGGIGQRAPALAHQSARAPFGTDRTKQTRQHHRKPDPQHHRHRRVDEALQVGAVGVLQAQQRGEVHHQRQGDQHAPGAMQQCAQWQEDRRQHHHQHREIVDGREDAELIDAGNHAGHHRPGQERQHARRGVVLRGEKRSSHCGHHRAVAAAFPADADPQHAVRHQRKAGAQRGKCGHAQIDVARGVCRNRSVSNLCRGMARWLPRCRTR